MNWSNVKLIWLREVRDQLRDRRTLFMVAVLPLLLYPLLGMSVVQVAQFLRGHPAKVLVVGAKQPSEFPPLFQSEAPGFTSDGQLDGAKSWSFVPALLPGGETDSTLFELSVMTREQLAKAGVPPSPDASAMTDKMRELMRDKGYDVVIYFPEEFWTRLKEFRAGIVAPRPAAGAEEKERPDGGDKKPAAASTSVPSPDLFANSVREESAPAINRVVHAIERWRDEIGAQNLREIQVPPTTAAPFELHAEDTAETSQKNAALWSKILPFVLLIWALTGAFYPAIDLCAGEKERGTLETLLSSPAERSEIVAGKLLAVMVFSMATSILNMISLGATGMLVLHQIGALQAAMHGASGLPMGAPPLAAMVWLLVALVPISALFSALCIALASFARSTKEGQYYLMPLVLITMPLMILPMSPGVELTFGNALVPLTGLMLLLRMLLEGNVTDALPYIPVVAGVTLLCCRVAMGWAVDQFNRESVLFRESERFDLRLWLLHLWRDRQATPTVAGAVCCGLLILLAEFFVQLLIAPVLKPTFAESAQLVLITQTLPILLPTLAMTYFLSRSPRQTLLLKWPKPAAAIGAIVLAVALVPLSQLMNIGLSKLFPATQAGEMLQNYLKALGDTPYWWIPLLLVAVLPAICEELAFRGFILSGLRHGGKRWRAILISALFFGVTHQVLQQSISAFVLGIVIAMIAVQTGSLLPGLLFHATYNCLGWLSGQYGEKIQAYVSDHPATTGISLTIAAFVATSLLWWFTRLKAQRTGEEQLQAAIDAREPAPEIVEPVVE